METFGSLLKKKRGENSLTQAAVAKVAKVTPVAVCYWEGDRRGPPCESSAQLSRIMGMFDEDSAIELGTQAVIDRGTITFDVDVPDGEDNIGERSGSAMAKLCYWLHGKEGEERAAAVVLLDAWLDAQIRKAKNKTKPARAAKPKNTPKENPTSKTKTPKTAKKTAKKSASKKKGTKKSAK